MVIRKALVMGVILLFAFTLAISTKYSVLYAEQKPLVSSVVFKVGANYFVFVNGSIHTVAMDAAPLIRDGRIFVPVRFLSNALGITNDHINWDDPKITLNQPGFPVVELIIGERCIVVDGQSKQMDVAPLIENGRTMLPARFVAEALGYQVRWYPVSRSVIIWPAGIPEPSVGWVAKLLFDQLVDAARVQQELKSYIWDERLAEIQIFELVNAARVQHGLKPYIWDERLAEVARSHSRDMLNNNFVCHISPTTGSPAARLSAAGINNWKKVGENIARQQTPLPYRPRRIFEAWM
ncbi:stalk domain-containing protein, partial [Peptococcaceae bacterium]|nr:stalk domain-containing protein [Peptococcaceae bacterium]